MMKLMFTCLVATAALVSAADVITMKSGSKFTGKVTHIEGGTIEFASDDLGAVKIKQENVVSMVTEGEKPVLFADKHLESGVVGCTNGTYTLNGNELQMAKVKAVAPVPEQWHGSVNLSAGAQRGNTVSESVTILADVNRRWEKDRLTASLGYYFGQSGKSKQTKQKTDSRFEIQAQEDHFWNSFLYNYVNGKYEFDQIMNLDYRYRLGVGFGLQWLDGRQFENLGKWSFNQELGISYLKEDYDHGYSDDYMTFRYAHHLTWDPNWIAGFNFAHNLEYLPSSEDWCENYLIDSDIGFTYAFIANWQLLGKIEWDYKSKVAEGTKHSDLRYILGLGYKW